MGVEGTVLPDGHPPPVAFTVLAQLSDAKANETEMVVALFTEDDEGRNFDFLYASNATQDSYTIANKCELIIT